MNFQSPAMSAEGGVPIKSTEGVESGLRKNHRKGDLRGEEPERRSTSNDVLRDPGSRRADLRRPAGAKGSAVETRPRMKILENRNSDQTAIKGAR